MSSVKTPADTFRDGRLDVLLGFRGAENDRALRVGEAAVLVRSTTISIISDTLKDVTAELTADVALSVTDTWYDGPYVPLSKGVWLITASAQHLRTDAAGGKAALRLMRGSDVICTAHGWHPDVADAGLHLALAASVRVTENALVKMQMRTEAGGATALLKAAAPYAGPEPATIITATRMRLLP